MLFRARNNMRRFLLHMLPPRFRRIRYYGFLAAPEPLVVPKPDSRTLYEKLTGHSLRDCPVCRVGAMIVTEVLVPGESPAAPPDTS